MLDFSGGDLGVEQLQNKGSPIYQQENEVEPSTCAAAFEAYSSRVRVGSGRRRLQVGTGTVEANTSKALGDLLVSPRCCKSWKIGIEEAS